MSALENMLNERRQTQREKYSMVSCIWNVQLGRCRETEREAERDRKRDRGCPGLRGTEGRMGVAAWRVWGFFSGEQQCPKLTVVTVAPLCGQTTATDSHPWNG